MVAPWLTLVIVAPLVGVPVLALWPWRCPTTPLAWVALFTALRRSRCRSACYASSSWPSRASRWCERAVDRVGRICRSSWASTGSSVWLVMLTTFMFPIAIAASWKVDKQVRLYMAMALFLESGDAGRVPVARPAAVLRVLRGAAGPDVPDHRRVGGEAPGLRGGEVLPVHDGRLGVPAGGDPVPVRAVRPPSSARSTFDLTKLEQLHLSTTARAGCSSRSSSAFAVKVPICPAAHLAARRAHRGADGGLRHPGRRHAEGGPVRDHPVQPGPVPRGIALLRVVDRDPRRHRHHVRRASWP